MRFFVLMFLLCFIPATAYSATIKIPGDMATIQSAIDASTPGDTVLVAPGTYYENLDFYNKGGITLKSERGGAVTIIDGNRKDTVVNLSCALKDTVLDGFTITNGYDGFTAGIRCVSASSPVIKNCIVHSNDSTKDYGAIFCSCADMDLINCLVHSNGMEIHCMDKGHIKMHNCTVLGRLKAEIFSYLTITNSNLWQSEIWLKDVDDPSHAFISWSNIDDNKIYLDQNCKVLQWGPGIINSDPLFVDAAASDFHLTSSSPCRDAGENSLVMDLYDFEGDIRINDWVDIGADEFSTHLYVTGDPLPGSSMNLKFIDTPFTNPVFLWLGSGLLSTPMSLPPHGEWHLQFPILFQVQLGAIGADGVLSLPCSIPSNLPTPLDLPLQGGIGNHLTNPFLLRVQ